MTQTVVGLWRLLEQNARELARLLVPLVCVGCAQPDHVLCPTCAGSFFAVPHTAQDQAPRLAGSGMRLWTCAAYAQPVNLIIMGWKDGRRVDTTAYLRRIMGDGAAAIAGDLLTLARVKAGVHVPRIVVVPLPSSARSQRIRGFVPAQELAKGVVQGLLQEVGDRAYITYGPGLSVAPTKTDQVGLNARKRAQNLSGTIKAGSVLQTQCHGADLILLVDDLVTTGATMRETIRVLPQHSGTLVAGFSLCVTPARGKKGVEEK